MIDFTITCDLRVCKNITELHLIKNGVKKEQFKII